MQRSRPAEHDLRKELERVFGRILEPRTERRYRRATTSQPHVDTLMQLSLLHMAAYSEVLRHLGVSLSDRGRHSLETLRSVRSFDDIPPPAESWSPQPFDIWSRLRSRYGEWPALLSANFPNLGQDSERMVRVGNPAQVPMLEPPMNEGTLVHLAGDSLRTFLEDDTTAGWQRPLFALRRDGEWHLGHVYGSPNAFRFHSREVAVLSREDGRTLQRVAAAVVPL